MASPMDIRLTFINQSNDQNNANVVVFQKNVAPDFDEIAVAWKVIQNCGQGWSHPFTFPYDLSVSASDSYGNYTPQLQAVPGQLFSLALTASGDTLTYTGPASGMKEIQVRNDLPQGSVNAHIYRDGSLLATKTGIVPGQKAVFQFKPTIWVGVTSQITQGQVMDNAILSTINTELSLLGIASADLVMTGGGPGPAATPFHFSLQNIVYA